MNPPDRPNIVIILTDDQGFQDVGCYGSPDIRTPALDGMAAEGAKANSFYAGQSICTPSRAALMTGCYAKRVGLACGVLFPESDRGLNTSEVTIAKLLQQSGYRTACVGKWHLGDHEAFLPTRHGFDSYFGIPYSNDMPPLERDKPTVELLDEVWEGSQTEKPRWNSPLMENEKVIEQPVDQREITDRYTDRAVSFIEEDDDRPFLLYFAHNMPHIPLYVPEARYDSDPHHAYRLVIEHIDHSVGRVLDSIRQKGIEEKTLVIFFSDNGPWLEKAHHGGSALPLRDGKFSSHEGGFRVPCILWQPGVIPAGSELDEPFSSIDFYPTFARLAGVDLPDERVVDGMDVWDYLSSGGALPSPRNAFCYYSKKGEIEGIREGDWKLVFTEEEVSLYNLKEDLSEAGDLSRRFPERVEALKAKAIAYDKSLEAKARPVGRVDN